MKSMIKALSLILSALMIFILPSCLDRSGTNPGGASDKESEALTEDISDVTTEAVTTEPPFDASVYTYTPSLKDESEMEFGIIITASTHSSLIRLNMLWEHRFCAFTFPVPKANHIITNFGHLFISDRPCRFAEF